MKRWQIPADAEGLTAEEWIAEMLTDGDRKQAAELLKDRGRLNAASVKPKEKLVKRDMLEIYTEDTPFAESSEIIYEDENLIVYNKEQDISCYTAKGELSPGLYELAADHMRETGEFNINSYTLPYLCHGIATNVGGIVLIAKDEILFRYVAEALAQRRIKRYYRCIVHGVPQYENFELHHKLFAKDKISRVQILEQSDKDGIPVYLRGKLLKTDGHLSLLEIDMVTDHPAQICAQLAYAKLPVLGDNIYGSTRKNKKLAALYPALWEYRIDFAVGKNNPLEYLDGTSLTAKPKMPYIKGLERIITKRDLQQLSI
ncbi:MAG: hypothetical protein IKK29_00740 [Christensenellaceae bacterium]|nr:hypothetical protein [Christensenellaceae bacterium]